MPPKAKFTREEIAQAALSLIEENGKDALTARNLGKKLGSSARPVFTAFNSMDEVFEAAEECANAVYKDYVDAGLQAPLPFKGVGEGYIKFASERPKLFRLLFMEERGGTPDMNGVLKGIEKSYDKILSSITENYGVETEPAKKLYLHLWIYSHGIAVLIATRVCSFTDGQISQMLTDVFTSLLIRVKKGELK